ncbi:hypothetical protein M8J77_022745 [Diaphorina citri]|nr:hypothetical protein M8J77_022745 [Diaphorina citri]
MPSSNSYGSLGCIVLSVDRVLCNNQVLCKPRPLFKWTIFLLPQRCSFSLGFSRFANLTLRICDLPFQIFILRYLLQHCRRQKTPSSYPEIPARLFNNSRLVE